MKLSFPRISKSDSQELSHVFQVWSTIMGLFVTGILPCCSLAQALVGFTSQGLAVRSGKSRGSSAGKDPSSAREVLQSQDRRFILPEYCLKTTPKEASSSLVVSLSEPFSLGQLSKFCICVLIHIYRYVYTCMNGNYLGLCITPSLEAMAQPRISWPRYNGTAAAAATLAAG